MGRRLVNRRPSRGGALLLGAIPFVAVLLVYLHFSAERLAVNPNDKLLPSPTAIGEAMWRMAFEADARSGKLLLWADTFASLSRLWLGIGFATLVGLVLGIAIGLIP